MGFCQVDDESCAGCSNEQKLSSRSPNDLSSIYSRFLGVLHSYFEDPVFQCVCFQVFGSANVRGRALKFRSWLEGASGPERWCKPWP